MPKRARPKPRPTRKSSNNEKTKSIPPNAKVSTTPTVDAQIYKVRGVRVMLDSDLAEVYGVETRRINEAVRRNPKRFTPRYSFQLAKDEWSILMSHLATSRSGWGGRRKLPVVFSEHGAVMLAAVLNSERAIAASHTVVDAFVRLRHLVDTNQALARKIDELAAKVDTHDRAIAVVFHELRQLASGPMKPDPDKPRRRIVFKTDREREAENGKQRGRHSALK